MKGQPLNLLDVVRRHSIPRPWAEGEKIPWGDPDFSQWMLDEHLSQVHDLAGRRSEIIDGHVGWIHDRVLNGNPTRILDLGCGPGLYTSRLARPGHRCVGIDFSPASIAYARQQAEGQGWDCTYVQQDIRTADYGRGLGRGYGLVMLIFGEFNVFRPGEAKGILEKAHRALEPGGHQLLEPHTFDAVQKIGEQPPSWYSAEAGLFGDEPHLCLLESFLDVEASVAIQRYFIVDAMMGEVTPHSSSMQAYTNGQYRSLLDDCGFDEVAFYRSLDGRPSDADDALMVILSRKGRAA
jgi:SAM-dependent methyltransferase